ncbi:serine hydrolase [Lactococcus insecticola]|uniref:Serine hydrolase n=1 Tax=Pseudolactococcus insecticola TaxID=2709158 RepID=A0A6A0B4V5_9LACT|nr:serine hydrolase [Lactococcus insecticola]GFH40390.1 hypothetical protein Hs20B_07880 [Lactococcus insecticola]
MKSKSTSSKLLLLVAAVFSALLILGITTITTVVADEPSPAVKTVLVYRLYNPNSGEHFYTTSSAERNSLVYNSKWEYEGIGWVAPENSSVPVYRLYNKNAGDHFYTLDANEKNSLVKKGWRYEGINFYSYTDNKNVPLLRAYNPNAKKAGSHNYTTNQAEQNNLIKVGWKNENVGWYAYGAGYQDNSDKGLVDQSNKNKADWEQQKKLSDELAKIKAAFNSSSNVWGAGYYDLTTGASVFKNQNLIDTSASTYKLFIALYVFHLFDTGQASWNSSYSGGSWRSGFYDMIHNSGNTFSEWIINHYGQSAIGSYLRSKGYAGLWTQPVRSTTSANDLVNILRYYYANRNNGNVKYLLGLMQGQIYRSGIPAATGKLVSDKVGFLWDIRNDAGIVFDGEHPYILVILTRNQSNFSQINTTAKMVQKAF